MGSPHGRVTGRAAVDPGAVRLHDRLGSRGKVRDRGEIDPLLPQWLTAAGTDRIGQSDLDWRCGRLVGGRQGAKGEVTPTWLSPRASGLWYMNSPGGFPFPKASACSASPR